MARKPNLIVVLIDDLRFDESSASGHPYMKTPNIDRLAHEGAMFENAFHTTPLCSPNREMYDLEKDPYELKNLASDPAVAKEREAVKKELRKLTAEALGI